MIGEFVIINEFDKPCTRLIAQVERVEGETVIARYVTTGTRMTHCSAHISEVTPVYKFGVMFEIEGGYISAAQISSSRATYRDGKPRNWQPAGEDERVKLRKPYPKEPPVREVELRLGGGSCVRTNPDGTRGWAGGGNEG